MKHYRLLGRWLGCPWATLEDAVPQEKQEGVLSIYWLTLGNGWEFHWEEA